MPDALELLKTRRSLKPMEMTGPGPSAAELDTILTIGSRVPDHGKLSPWRFIVFEGDGRTRAGEIFAKLFAQKNPQATPDQIEKERTRFSQAPLVIAVVSKTVEHFKVPAWEQELSVLSDHQFHNPPQIVLAKSVAAEWFDEAPVSESYDFREEVDAQYVIIGPFAKYTNLYPPDRLTEFELLESVGAYDIYHRTS